MELKNETLLPADAQLSWEALNDPDVLRQCIPGCESMQRIDEDGPDPRYEMQVVVAVGPVKAKFKARLTIKDVVAPLHYTIVFEGQGGAAGHAKGEARVSLESIDANQTMLKYDAKATIGGRVAQVGSRLVDSAAKKLAGEFFDRFNTLMTPAEETPTEESPSEADSADAPEISALKRSWWDRVRKRRAH